MIELTILACVAVLALAALVYFQSRTHATEREQWRNERRFLIDRAIARHVGEVVALEREDTRKENPPPSEPSVPRHLIEGLS